LNTGAILNRPDRYKT